MNKKLLALYGLKWNPFCAELPTEALYVTPKIEAFCWRIEQALIREGGFAMITGDPGAGKSVVLRLLAERLSAQRDISVGAVTHPTSTLGGLDRFPATARQKRTRLFIPADRSAKFRSGSSWDRDSA